eukprot:4736820-Amphidinium_carterae.1
MVDTYSQGGDELKDNIEGRRDPHALVPVGFTSALRREVAPQPALPRSDVKVVVAVCDVGAATARSPNRKQCATRVGV